MDLQDFQDRSAFQGRASRGRRAWRVLGVHPGRGASQERAHLDPREIKVYPERQVLQEREEQENQELRVNQELQGSRECPACQGRTERQGRRVNQDHRVSEGWRGRPGWGLRERRETKVREESGA